jgi:TIR domain-containing protein
MPDAEKIDFFISYRASDKSWAEWVAWQLEEAGYTTFLQAWAFGRAATSLP